MTAILHTMASLHLPNADATAAFGRWLSPRLAAGDTLLLDGPLGAGKSHLARAIIRARMAALGRAEDVPSPTFTIVQSYDADVPIVHADLYRLTSPDEAAELGLTDAFDAAIVLIEWPARLGPLLPTDPLILRIAGDGSGDARMLTLSGPTSRWASLIADAVAQAATG